MLKEGSSNFGRNTIPKPAHEAPDTTQFGYASPIQCQYPWPYNLAPKLQGIARISAFGPLVVSETNQYQIPTNATMATQNGNRPSQDARQRRPMTPIRNTPVSTQTATKTSTQLILSKKSAAIEVRFKKEKFSGAPTNALTKHFETSTYMQTTTASPMMNVLS